jgi:uncharacterized protein YjiS (DUF1127 family)
MSRYEGNLTINVPVLAAAWVLVAAVLRHWLDLLLTCHERVRSRRQLAGLNERLLRDIGLDRATAVRELDKSFWQA